MFLIRCVAKSLSKDKFRDKVMFRGITGTVMLLLLVKMME